ncbi:MAG TPA: type VI secretion system baseplate subunit TssE [Telluria sp.]|nr:type VI secretion system baseplate subunit TssE [Telluria sp.]
MQKHLFASSIWDRLMAAGEAVPAVRAGSQTLPELKAAIAHDLEDMFNTRVALPAGMLDRFKACRHSILNFGLMDFAALCLASSEDRKIICDYLKEVINRFEPRLCNVRADIVIGRGATNRLDFVIQATLKDQGSAEQIEFNAMLQPSTLQYSISQAASGCRSAEPRP